MAEFGFTEAQDMFRTMARDFARRELMPGAKERAGFDRYPEDVVKKVADAGFLGLRIPEKYGGQMSDLVTCGIACEEIAKADLAPSFLISDQMVAGEILVHCLEEVQAEWMPLFAKGRKLICFWHHRA